MRKCAGISKTFIFDTNALPPLVPRHSHQRSIGGVPIESFRVKVLTRPFEEFLDLVPYRIALQIAQEILVAERTAAIVRWTSPLAGFDESTPSRLVRRRRSCFHDDPMLPVVAEVVDVFEMRVSLKSFAQRDSPFIDFGERRIVFGIGNGIDLVGDPEFVKMGIRPPHGCLNGVMH